MPPGPSDHPERRHPEPPHPKRPHPERPHAGPERRRVVYRGTVQGVGFRATVRSIAADFRVAGFVRNEPDGSVLLEAQGDAAELDRFLGSIRQRLARRIRDERTVPLEPLQGDQGFRIER